MRGQACPRCGAETFVRETRVKGDDIRRRRECSQCGHRFSTIEIHVDVWAAEQKKLARPKAIHQGLERIGAEIERLRKL